MCGRLVMCTYTIETKLCISNFDMFDKVVKDFKHVCPQNYLPFLLLTLCHPRAMADFSNMFLCNLFQWLISWTVQFTSCENHRTSLIIVNIGSGNGLVPLGTKSLPELCWPSCMQSPRTNELTSQKCHFNVMERDPDSTMPHYLLPGISDKMIKCNISHVILYQYNRNVVNLNKISQIITVLFLSSQDNFIHWGEIVRSACQKIDMPLTDLIQQRIWVEWTYTSHRTNITQPGPYAQKWDIRIHYSLKPSKRTVSF